MQNAAHRENNATINPFAEEKPHIATYTAQEIATLQSRLDRQLGPEYISTRPGQGGGKVHYLAAEKVIQLANEIFGFNGWSSQIQNVQVDFVDENTTNGKITLGLSTIVRVTLRDGTFHEDIGYGHIENCKGKAAAFEKAKKEATTDALKRALRNFGNVLGNCLYDKEYLTRVAKIKLPPSRWDSDRLHRHQDYAPVKVDAAPQEVHRKDAAEINIPTLPSFGSVEFDDDFGGTAFDESDFTRTDEVRLDNASFLGADGPASNTKTIHSLPNQPQRMHSAPLGVPSVHGPRAPSPALKQNGQNGPAGRPSHVAPHTPMNKPQPMLQPRPQDAANLDGLKSNQSSGSTLGESPIQPNPARAGTHPQNVAHNSGDLPNELPLPMEVPVGAPQGFVSSRAAGMDVPSEFKLSGSGSAFNPHAESPSIRRTQGVNPGVSAKIWKKQVTGNTPSGEAHAPATASPTPPIRTNFINPSADATRRVGMPAAPASMANRGQYRPPTTIGVKRPPLTDVTNQAPVENALDGKKPRTDVPSAITGQAVVE